MKRNQFKYELRKKRKKVKGNDQAGRDVIFLFPSLTKLQKRTAEVEKRKREKK